MFVNLAFLIMGILILLAVTIRASKLFGYIELQNEFERTFDILYLDLSGNTSYTDCFSHEWVYDEAVFKRHNAIGRGLNNFLADNALVGSMCLSILLFMASLILWAVLLPLFSILGMALFVVATGLMLVIGPGGPKTSEELLTAISNQKMEDLKEEDYVYVRVAISEIKKWVFIIGVAGVIFLFSAPFGENLPMYLATAATLVVSIIIWFPVVSLQSVWFPLAFFYVAAIVPIVFVTLWWVGSLILGVVQTPSGKFVRPLSPETPPDVERFRDGW
ncbi:MAG: hypothetical protein RTU30_03100 [Candidatus Thorarchaeota archaeon]